MTAQRLVERSLTIHADAIAVIDGDRSFSYRELQDRSGRLANALLSHGCSADSPAASWLPNRAEFVEFDAACTRSGITRLGIGERLSSDECEYMLSHSQSKVLLTTPELRDRLSADCLASLAGVLVIDGTDTALSNEHAYEETLAAASPQLVAREVAPEDPCYLMYTSGTTGRAKGATQSHGGRVASTVNMLASELRRFDSDVVFIHAAPLTHGSGSKIISVLAVGGTNLILRRFDLDAFAHAIRNGRGTHTFLVPTMLQRLLEAEPDVQEAVRLLRQVSFGGSPISPLSYAQSLETFGPILTQIYGSSEVPHPVTLLQPEESLGADERTLMSAGRAAFGCDIKVVDDEGSDVRHDGVGELLIRAAHAMSGYWRDPDATRDVFTDDGWYRTGDLATLGKDGLVTFHDRKRDLIITGGLNVYPSEVERVLLGHPGVRDVVVVGAPDPEWGESVAAYVIPEGTDVSEAELIDYVRDRLAGYKKPRRIVFLESFPLGASNKVLKRRLRDELWEGQSRRVG